MDPKTKAEAEEMIRSLETEGTCLYGAGMLAARDGDFDTDDAKRDAAEARFSEANRLRALLPTLPA